VRFEDITTKHQSSLEEMFRFLLNTDNLDGTFIKRRIDEVAARGKEASTLYKPRSTTGVKSSDYDNEEHVARINERFEHFNKFFGYAKLKGQESTEAKTYAEYEAKEGDDQLLGQFRQSNKEHLQWAFEKGEEIDNLQVSCWEEMLKIG